jgi:hypothetical protein
LELKENSQKNIEKGANWEKFMVTPKEEPDLYMTYGVVILFIFRINERVKDRRYNKVINRKS